jgi:phosphate transport system permease protein
MPTSQADPPESSNSESSWAAAGAPTASLRRRNLLDRLARWVVTAGGLAIVAGVLGILVFIVKEVLPMLGGADVKPLAAVTVPASARVLTGGVDEHETMGFVIGAGGRIEYFPLGDAAPPAPVVLAKAEGRTLTGACSYSQGREFALGTSDGFVLGVSHQFDVSFQAVEGENRSRRSVAAKVTEGELLALDPQGKPIVALARQARSGTTLTAGVTLDGRLLYHAVTEKKSMLGKAERKESALELTAQLPGVATALVMDGYQEFLFVGTRSGHLVIFELGDPAAPRKMETQRANELESAAVTAVGLLIGERSLVVGDAEGGVRVWCDIEDAPAERGRTFKAIHTFGRGSHAVTSIASSQRDKGFATGDAGGHVVLRHSTSEQELATLKAEDSPVSWVGLSPRATALFAAHENGNLRRWSVDNPHPEISMGTLFGRVWYEGYDKPDLSWQSTGSTDDFEPKLSLVPLIIGTFKGTLFALIIAVPLAILGALYTAQFMHPLLRGWVKPTVEIMAGLPSVVLGFIAGLWLAPTLEKVWPAIFLMFIVLPLSCLGAMTLFRMLPEGLRHRHGEKLEILCLIPTLLVAGWICLQLNAPFENLAFGGHFGRWVHETLGLRFEQKNSLIVGIAMGFAVIPIIFTISEDSLSNVPRHLSSGSLALGATRWQTAVRVVLPAALPGIFSAVMIGLGRAVGETMIVLMATGNTPTFDWWNPFSGFRTLSATIAVEIPEAPHGGTLYRTLFLGALLLFACTFVVNTAAELVRQRMRRRYAQL